MTLQTRNGASLNNKAAETDLRTNYHAYERSKEMDERVNRNATAFAMDVLEKNRRERRAALENALTIFLCGLFVIFIGLSGFTFGVMYRDAVYTSYTKHAPNGGIKNPQADAPTIIRRLTRD